MILEPPEAQEATAEAQRPSPRPVDPRELVAELQALDLTEVEARKAAFVTLTWCRGWTTTRIGRYLGVSRVRVDQRVERLRRYADTREVPLLSQLLAGADRGPSVGEELPVAFPSACWADPIFALGMLQIVSESTMVV